MSMSKPDKPTKITVWNLNDPQAWKKFHELTQHDKKLINCWKSGDSTERCYQMWTSRLNFLMHQCFRKKKVTITKAACNREIRIFFA